MNYTLKVIDNKVSFLLKTGNDFVKSVMTESTAKQFLDKGKVTKSENTDFPICVDNKWYFAGTITETTTSKKKKGVRK